MATPAARNNDHRPRTGAARNVLFATAGCALILLTIEVVARRATPQVPPSSTRPCADQISQVHAACRSAKSLSAQVGRYSWAT